MTTKRVIAAAAAACAAASVAGAPARAAAEKPVVMFGLGPGATTRFEGSDEYRAVPFVFGQLRWRESGFFLGTDGGGVRADIAPGRFIEAGPEVSFRFGRNPADARDPALGALPEIDQSIEVGGFFAMNLPAPFTPKLQDALTLDLSHVSDVTAGHNGALSRVSVRYRGKLARNLAVQVGPFATFADDDFMSSFYDVSADAAAAAGLDAFDAGEGWKDYGVRGSAVVMLGGRWQVILSGAYRHYINDAAESPIVAERGSEGVWFGGGALSRRF